MSDQVPRLPGWEPDPDTGGTAYWDGERFTGDRRPPRRKFAAAARHNRSGAICIVLCISFLVTAAKALRTPEVSVWVVEDSSDGLLAGLARALDDATYAFSPEAFASMATYLAIGAALGGLGAYLLRGRGPTSRAVERRLRGAPRSQARESFASFTRDGESAVRRPGPMFGVALQWLALNLTDVGRAQRAFERGDDAFSATLRVDRTGYRRKVERIEERGWILVDQRWNRKKKESIPNSDGTHTVRSTQTARFFFVRDGSLDR